VTADQDVLSIEQGADPNPTGFQQGWMSRIRGRKIVGDNINKAPFTRSWTVNGVLTQVVASCMNQDKITAIADAVGFRVVDSAKRVLDVGDMIVIGWEYFLLKAEPDILAQAISNASVQRKWPSGYKGSAPFDTGGQ
jgi:hypothetical protein